MQPGNTVQPPPSTFAGEIRRLPDDLINQIAAGEVVERPASVLKELVENSIDAGADRIDVTLVDGGMTCLTILDNGKGMNVGDLELCIERHTTSKLTRFDDLERIGTYGFRGEALSSISSVAEVEIRSRLGGDSHAHALEVHYGERRGEIRPTAGPSGTCISVKNLFARLPARQKFLRSVATEFSHAARTLREIALGNPAVAFYLYHGEKLVHSFRGKSRAERFDEIFHVDWKPFYVTGEADGAHFEAFLSPPSLIQDRGELFLFINSRPVKHKTIALSVRKAYADILGSHHEPSGALYLDIRKDWVDVNVHPQKLEVRLLRQDTLFQWMGASVRKALGQAQPTTAPVTDAKPSTTFYFVSPDALPPMTKEKPSGPHFAFAIPGSSWVYQADDGLFFVDPHALDEKSVFDELQTGFALGTLGCRPLPSPVLVRLSDRFRGASEDKLDFLRRLGFDMEAFGENDVAVKGIPALSPELDAERELPDSQTWPEILNEILRAISGKSSVDRIFAIWACGIALRRDAPTTRRLTDRIGARVNAKLAAERCPHQRPVAYQLRKEDIDKFFER